MWLCSGSSLAWAQQKRDIPVNQILESSLTSLKDSAQKVQERNQWLSLETQRLQNEIKEYKKDLEKLEEGRSKLTAGVAQQDQLLNHVSKEATLVEKGVKRLNKDINQLTAEEKDIEAKIEANRQGYQEIKNQIESRQKEISQLKERGVTLSNMLSGKDSNIEKEKLLKSIEASKKNVGFAQKKLKQLAGERDRPLTMISDLEKKQKLLKEQLSGLEQEYGFILEEEKNVINNIENVKKEKETQLPQLTEEVNQLKVKSNELEDVLSKAKAKLKESELNLANGELEESQLRQNLTVIKKETIGLKDELLSLGKTLEQIENN